MLGTDRHQQRRVLWGHQPTHMAASSRLRPRPQSASRRSGSEARQSALQVDKGCGFLPPRRSGQGSCPSRPSTPSKCPCKVRPAAGPSLAPASIPNLPLVEQPDQLANDGASPSRACTSPVILFLKTSLQQPLISWGCCNHVPQSGGFKHRNVFSEALKAKRWRKGV